MNDFFDPNNWEVDNYEYRIYADDYSNDYALVDQIDYPFLVQWRWSAKASKGNKKIYLRRSISEIIGPDIRIDGKRHQQRIQRTVFLHTVVMERTGLPKPITNEQIIVDHANGNGLDCRRRNLRYATLTFNNRNRHGCLEFTFDL